jgi:Fe-S cluster assembly protein SufD
MSEQISMANENADISPQLWGDTAIDTVKQQAATELNFSALPPAKAEMWRNFSIAQLRDKNLAPAVPALVSDPSFLDKAWLQQALVLEFSNGHLVTDVENLPISEDFGCQIVTISAEDMGNFITTNKVKSAASLLALNVSQTQCGVCIEISSAMQAPIVILHSHSQLEALITPTIQVKVAANGKAELTEVFVGGADSLAVPAISFEINENAQVDYTRWHQHESNAAQLGVLSASVYSGANFLANCVTTSGKNIRLDAEVNIVGEQAHAELNGLSLVEDGQQTGLYYRVNHLCPNATSNQTVRVVANNKAKHIYDGYIYVAHGADGTDARQSSKALLLTKRAQALANPRLEILTDDVSCAHGATIGFLDEDALFYLQSRGIPKSQAQALLVQGFTTEALNSICSTELKAEINAYIQQHYKA